MTDSKQEISENSQTEQNSADQDKRQNKVRSWTFIVLGVCILLVTWYIRADRVTPFTSQARVNAMVVPIASEVSGVITSVKVGNNQHVKKGDILFEVDKRNYEVALQMAKAQYETARHSTASSASGVDAAKARVQSAEANLLRAKKDADRMYAIRKKDKGAISERRLETAEASLKSAEGSLANAKAKLKQAQENYGSEGDLNSRIVQAQANLDQATYNLNRTTIKAPDDGLVTGVRLDAGNFAGAGSPLMTFVATGKSWIQADFTENNLGKMKPGMTVEAVFDIYPGKVFPGKVREISYGVAVDSTPLGSLPTVGNNRDWLRDAQRFQVLIDLAHVPQELESVVKVGSQVSVVVYTGKDVIWNPLAWLYIRLVSILTYAY